jgi:hypothetical protein
MALASAARVISKTVVSPGVLFDAVPRGSLAAAGTSTSLVGQVKGFFRNANHDMASYWAKSHVVSSFADFNEKVFEQELAPVSVQQYSAGHGFACDLIPAGHIPGIPHVLRTTG